MLIVGLGEAGKNIANLFKPHTKTYKILTFDEGEGLDMMNTLSKSPLEGSNRTLKGFCLFVGPVR